MTESQYFFYLARCNDGSLYSGFCMDLTEREAAHNEGRGAKYTRSRLPIKIVYSEKFALRTQALSREATVKRWKKADKEALIASKPKRTKKAP